MAQSPLRTPPAQAIDIDRIYAPVRADLKRVEASLKQIVTPEAALLMQAVSHSLEVNGKMFRPLLSLLMAGASGDTQAPIDNRQIETAAVAELIHIATLMHDDVLDDADLRRGRQTVRSLWGNKVSILGGDYLLAQASLKLSRLDNCRLVSIFAQVLADLCEGEVEQIRTGYNLQPTWDSYYRKSRCKTASLFGACCEAAAVINALPEPHIQSLRLFGEKFGIAFQIIDDLLDYTSSADQLGKPVLEDLHNGILNAPVLIALERLQQENPAQYERFKTIIEALFDEHADRDALKQPLMDILDSVQAVEATRGLANRLITEARETLAFLPDSQYRQALLDLTDYAVQRAY